MAAALDFAINPHFSARVMYVGRDGQPVLIVDDLLRDPEAIIRYAATGAPFRKEDKDFYPGIRKPLSTAYADSVYLHLQQLFLDTFGAGMHVAITPRSCMLSLTTTRAEHLRPIQSVPHFDSFDGDTIAGVHYLCADEFGGTAFYRHRSTGYESLNAERMAEYAPGLKEEVMALQTRSFSYIRGDTALFERTGSVEAKFNRAIFYRSNVLHSGDIADAGLSAEPRKGRLTVNTLGLLHVSAQV